MSGLIWVQTVCKGYCRQKINLAMHLQTAEYGIHLGFILSEIIMFTSIGN